jgi:hypothetical protein
MASKATLALVTVVATTTATSGCYSTWDIAPRTLVRLDGFREGQTRMLVSADAEREEVKFTADSELIFRDAKGNQISGQFRSLDLTGPVLVGVRRDNNVNLEVDLSRSPYVSLKNFSVGKTIGATVGVVAAVPVTVVLGLFVLLAAGGGFGGGRPLRIAGQHSPKRAFLLLDHALRTRSRGGRAPRADAATEAALFAHWAKEASSECASIPAFLALARDLELASAPRGLVEMARRAAREEATHTQLCTTLANDHTHAPIAAWTPPTPSNVDIDRESLLLRLAMEAFWDGCVAEGAAAAVARRSAPLAKDEATHDALRTIARDEQNHAELSKQIVAYCLSAGGRPIRDALVESLESSRGAEESRIDRDEEEGADGALLDQDLALAHGLAGNDIWRSSRAEVWEKSVSDLSRV